MSPGRIAVISPAAVAVIVAGGGGSGGGGEPGGFAQALGDPAQAFTGDPEQIESRDLSISSFL